MAGEFRGSGKYQIGDEKSTTRKRKKRGGFFRLVAEPTHVEIGVSAGPGLFMLVS